MAPNVFHIGVNEQVSIAVFDAGNPVNVKLYLQDYPHRQKTFSQVHGQVKPGKSHFASTRGYKTLTRASPESDCSSIWPSGSLNARVSVVMTKGISKMLVVQLRSKF